MSFSHIFGTAVFFINVIYVFAQRPSQIGQNPFAATQGFGMRQGMQNMFNGQRRFGGGNGGFNIPPPAGFQQVNRQFQNNMPFQLQNALPRNPTADGNNVNGVLSVLNGGGAGFTGRFGAATGHELQRQLTLTGEPGAVFTGTNNPQARPGFTQFNQRQNQLPSAQLNRIQQPNMFLNRPGQNPNMPFQRPPMMQFGQQFGRQGMIQPSVVGNVPPTQSRGPRNQPQAVMPMNVQGIDMSSILPGQRLPNEPSLVNRGMPSNQQQGQTTRFGRNTMMQPQQPQTFGVPSQTIRAPQATIRQQPSQTFGPQQIGQPQTFIPPQPVAPQPSRPTQIASQGQSSRTSIAFPDQTLTQSLGVGRPASQVNVPDGAPPMLPGEVEIAPPISPAEAAQMQGSSANPPQAVSEIITISDINGNVLYRGVDLSDTEIEKITQQLVSNMTDAQAAEAAARGRELEAQGKLDSAGAPQSTGQTSSASLSSQPSTQQASGGFSSWGQQSPGIRFPGQNVVGESRTVVDFLNPSNTNEG